MIKLLQRQTNGRIRFELGIASKRLGYALVLVVEDRWKRSKEVSCQNGPVVFRQVLSKLLDFSDRGHGTIIVGSHLEASERTLRDTITAAYSDPEFFKDFKKITGNTPSPLMPDQFDEIINKLPRNPEDVDLF